MFVEAICSVLISALSLCEGVYVDNAAMQQYIETSNNAVVMAAVDDESIRVDLDLNPILCDWDDADDGLYYYDKVGVPKTGWFRDGNNLYFLEDDGRPTMGWYEEVVGDAHNIYYFDDCGVMVTGFAEINQDHYYFNSEGIRQAGFVVLSDEGTRYFDELGVMHTGWLSLDGHQYYFDDAGLMAHGWTVIDGTSYHFNDDGQMTTGWLTDGDKVYYLQEDGHVSVGWQDIDGVSYYFDENGVKQTGSTYVPDENTTYYLYDDGGYASDTVVDGSYYGPNGQEEIEYYDSASYIHNGNVTYFNTDYSGWGRLYIPDVGINVALYCVDYYDDQDAQWICDAEDSAVYMTGWGVTPFIGDHTNQGFSGIRSCVDDTKAFIRHDGNTYVYDCTYVGGGTNDGYNIYDWNGEMIWSHGSNDLGMYTCNGNWQNVSIVLFSLIDVL